MANNALFELTAAQENRIAADQRLTAVANLIQSAEGRYEIAASLTEPLRQWRDYSGIGRRAFRIDNLAQGDLPVYDKDVDTPAFIIGEEGREVQVVVRGQKVVVPLFLIASYLQIPITQIREKRYDLQTRVKEKSKTEIVREEDRYIFELFKAIASNPNASNKLITTTKANVNIDTFSEAKALIESWGDVNATNMFINPVHEVILRKMNKDRFIDFDTTKQLLDLGYIGNLFNMRIHKSVMVPKDMIFFTAEPEFFGVMPIGQDITILNADDPKELKLGYSIFEQLGVYVHGDKGLAAVKITG